MKNDLKSMENNLKLQKKFKTQIKSEKSAKNLGLVDQIGSLPDL